MHQHQHQPVGINSGEASFIGGTWWTGTGTNEVTEPKPGFTRREKRFKLLGHKGTQASTRPRAEISACTAVSARSRRGSLPRARRGSPWHPAGRRGESGRVAGSGMRRDWLRGPSVCVLGPLGGCPASASSTTYTTYLTDCVRQQCRAKGRGSGVIGSSAGRVVQTVLDVRAGFAGASPGRAGA